MTVFGLVGVTTASISIAPPASAVTLGYPWSQAPCIHNGNVAGLCPNYDWAVSGQVYNWSIAGFGYRNCTDYTAWKLNSLGVPTSKLQGLGHGGQWADNAWKNGLSWSTTPKAGAAAVRPSTSGDLYGHVAFVEAVHPDGSITVSEYNAAGTGEGSTWTGIPSARGFTKFVDFGVSMGPGEDNFSWRQMTYIDSSSLNNGQSLLSGQYMMSSNGQWALVLNNGNLALYSGSGGPRWQTGTSGSPSALTLQNDGNLVLYGPAGSILWSTSTAGNSGDNLVVQNDGNVVLYSWSGVAIWATNTSGGFTANNVGTNAMSNGQSISRCSALTSSDGRFRFALTCSGELLMYGPGYSVMWRTGTSGSNSALALQNDGNLVLYGPNGSVLWNTGTWGNSGDNLVVQNDGNVVLYSWSGVAIWATNTG